MAKLTRVVDGRPRIISDPLTGGHLKGVVSMAEPEDFTAFVNARQAGLVRLGWALTGDRQLGEDLAQATLDRPCARWLKEAQNER